MKVRRSQIKPNTYCSCELGSLKPSNIKGKGGEEGLKLEVTRISRLFRVSI